LVLRIVCQRRTSSSLSSRNRVLLASAKDETAVDHLGRSVSLIRGSFFKFSRNPKI
jgi:hypothetical protein